MNLHNVLVIGSGGREHAIVSALMETSTTQVEKVYVSSGNFGTASENIHKCQNINEFSNFEEIVEFVRKHHIELVIVGPEQPLCGNQ